MTRFKTSFGIILCLIMFLTSPLLAGAQPPPPLTGDDRGAIVDQISNALLETYVFPNDAEVMAQRLAKQLESGAYDDATDFSVFCHLLNQDLHSVRRDPHLHVDFAPPQPAEPGGAQQVDEEKRMLEKLPRLNYGFRRLELLEGNIGYLRLDAFIDASLGGATAIAAMAFLANADAMIFDLRNNGGGSPSMIQLISSYLFEEPTHLNSFYIRRRDTTKEFWTQSDIQGERRSEVPVFVLTSDRTFSAAEEFAYNLKHLGRATIVGERTRGGAHPVERFRVEGYPMVVSLPFGRAINPITGTNWEGTGVEPDVKVVAERALDTAHLEVLEMIADMTEDTQRKQELELTQARVKSRVDPIDLDETEIQAYVGAYGPHRVIVKDKNLVLLIGGNLEMPMIGIGDDRFVLDGMEEVLVTFERNENGDVVAATSLHDGIEERHPHRQG
jgi:hypothetical protein